MEQLLEQLREIIASELSSLKETRSLSREISNIDETISALDEVLSYLHEKLIETEDWTSTPFLDLFRNYKDLVDSKTALIKLRQEIASSSKVDVERLAEALRKISNMELESGHGYSLSEILEQNENTD